MASWSLRTQAVAFVALMLSVAATTSEEVSHPPIPAVGPSLAQGGVKFQSPARHAEEMNANAMADFASLDDIFDDDDQATPVMESPEEVQAAGSSLAQGAMKFHGLTHPSEIMRLNPMADFANLDDIFDENVEAMQPEVQEFSMEKLLANPSLYFTLALAITGVLMLTATTEQQEPLQQQLQRRQVAQAEMPIQAVLAASSVAVPEARTETDVRSKAVAEQSTPVVAAEVTPEEKAPAGGEETPVSSSPAVPKLDLAPAPETDVCPRTDSDAVLAAMDACRAGQSGSYANFCKLLAAQSDMQ